MILLRSQSERQDSATFRVLEMATGAWGNWSIMARDEFRKLCSRQVSSRVKRDILLFRDTALRIKWSRNWSFLIRYTRLVATGGMLILREKA
ncbi:hypothetical protein ES703_80343 [subsurface metagenome]